MKLTAIAFLLVPSLALPVKSDAFPILHTNHRGGLHKDITITTKTARHGITNLVGHHHPMTTSNQASSLPLERRRGWNINHSITRSSHSSLYSSTSSSSLMDIRGGDASSTTPSSTMDKTKAFVSKNFFLLGMVVAVTFAKLFPQLGKNGSILHPEIFIGQYGVTTIFLLSGLSLKLTELTNAFSNLKLNTSIQAITFAAWPFLIGYPLTSIMEKFVPNLLPLPIREGLLILTCLPTTINMCILLTSASGGNVATALCNTVISNLAGIALTPMLLLRFFGKGIELPFGELVGKLCNKVLVPVAVGQALRATSVKDFYSKHTSFFKRLQEMVLLGIVWNAFCNAFTRGLGLELHHGIILLILLPLLHIGSLATLFALFRSKLFSSSSSSSSSTSMGEAIAATFCGAHKTLAFGLPLINTVFEGNPNLASYCAPIMLMHPLQLVIGSLIVPYFKQMVEEEENVEKVE